MPKVSVIMPSYNHAAFISAAVNSVIAQSISNWELIIVDDGSTDESLSILSKFADPRIKLITQPNQGAHAAFNRGLAQASGQYLALLNSDDCYHPQRLEKLIQVLEADPGIGLAASYIEVIDEEGKTLGIKHGYHDLEPWLLAKPEKSFRAGEDLHAALLTENYLATTSNYVFARRWYEQIGGFRNLRYVHDWDFALRMAQFARLELITEPLLQYRVHHRNTIRENRAAMIFEICWILAIHLPQQISGSWFQQVPLDERVDQILHSIYVYGADRVLATMLLQKPNEDTQAAMCLLDPNDLVRIKYLDYIEQQVRLEHSNAVMERTPRPRKESGILALSKKIAKRIHKFGR